VTADQEQERWKAAARRACLDNAHAVAMLLETRRVKATEAGASITTARVKVDFTTRGVWISVQDRHAPEERVAMLIEGHYTYGSIVDIVRALNIEPADN
jgi:hypothetical protein